MHRINWVLSIMILLGNWDWGSFCLVNKADSVGSSCGQSGCESEELVNSDETIYPQISLSKLNCAN